ncbi:N(2)-fixation sustaining protein CowN [Rhodoplanes sp. TEM]|uniref:N(2)-fixation sustaining protein CowN n=1 Tax=Rhodoplanes tepidamans TaxID=200616 RepID=A0ABT5J4N3_RHOTP|nr:MULTISPECIES: N(2)-fixation sustaining protein CowN [Rhodoplanes]MDC7784488.1 N(2)-fixation sustaining protein CowN [Rhodoplanes tepidamans]MDC7983518.1 N(2)-fixation sustaining protein CowN [Rhodoplanes sp. TEM]MDQ0356996.1 hypothetical protein [Rhodoplanes tepidamans]
MRQDRQDRYVTFRNIDCEGMTRTVMAHVLRHVAAGDSPFWPYFEEQRALAHGRGFDDLRVLHNFLPTLKELLDDLGDEETLALLEELETQCM